MLRFFFLPSGELEMGWGGFEDPMRMVWEVRAIISFLWDANLRLVCKLVYVPACSQTALYSRITGKPQWLCPKAVQSGDSSTSEICLLSRLGWKSRVGGVAIGGRTWMKLICSTQTFSGTKKNSHTHSPNMANGPAVTGASALSWEVWAAHVNAQPVWFCTCKAVNPPLVRCNDSNPQSATWPHGALKPFTV